MDNTSIFDLVIAGSGIYLVYVALLMKRTGEIKQGVIISKDINVNRIRDKEGFIHYMFPKVMLIGILAAVVGAGSMMNTALGGPDILEIIGIVIYLVVLALFAVASGKARKKYIV